jgi:glycosyltransferase involved in cell wall biosynthesis
MTSLPSRVGSKTHKISILLSCLNEMEHGYLAKILDNLERQVGEKEIIAVVSPSHDQTLAFLERQPQVKVISTQLSNRAQRFDLCLKASTGDIVLFHHAATLLPDTSAFLQIIQALETSERVWGGFHHSFDRVHWLLRFTSWYSNQVRGKQKGILYFDHCIFGWREAFIQVGGIGDRAIFADTDLSKKLCQLSYPLFCDGMVVTSARRFCQRGIYRQALLNQWLKLLYHFGVNDRTMNLIYEGKNPINVAYPKNFAKKSPKNL